MSCIKFKKKPKKKTKITKRLYFYGSYIACFSGQHHVVHNRHLVHHEVHTVHGHAHGHGKGDNSMRNSFVYLEIVFLHIEYFFLLPFWYLHTFRKS
jgi:hypothetical protein